MQFEELNEMLNEFFERVSLPQGYIPQDMKEKLSWLRAFIPQDIHKKHDRLSSADILFMANKIKPVWKKYATLPKATHDQFMNAYFLKHQPPELNQQDQSQLGYNGEILMLFARIMDRLCSEYNFAQLKNENRIRSAADEITLGFMQEFEKIMQDARIYFATYYPAKHLQGKSGFVP